MKKILLVSMLILTACSGGNSVEPSEQGVDKGPSISIEKATIAPPLAGRDVAAGYMQITSLGRSDQLIGASTPDATSIELHTHLHEDGVMKMREVDAIDLPAGETVTFERGGYHLMIFGATFTDGHDTVPVTLDFQTADDVTIMMAIEPASGSHGNGHEGH